jgi:hypothetical protein
MEIPISQTLGVIAASTAAFAISSCGLMDPTYHCRITEVVAEGDQDIADPNPTEFVMSVTEETDIYLAGSAPAAGYKDPEQKVAAFIVISKLDGKFEGAYILRGTVGTINAGFCKER